MNLAFAPISSVRADSPFVIGAEDRRERLPGRQEALARAVAAGGAQVIPFVERIVGLDASLAQCGPVAQGPLLNTPY